MRIASPSPSSPLNIPRAVLILLCALLALVWFAQLNIRHLIPTDEGRYAEVAREMLVSGDWLAPHYNGYLYFEKPPLQLWMSAAAFKWFGIGAWQARLYPALCGFLGVLLAGFTGARIFSPRAGLCAALVLVSSPYWSVFGHFNTLDMGLAFWMQVCLCAFLLAQRPNLTTTAVRGWMGVCWLSMGLAVLSNGLVGLILPGVTLIIYTLIARDRKLWKRLYFKTGILILAAIAAPWFVLVQQRYPAFFNFFFIVQHFKRYLTLEQHQQAFYYFMPVIVAGFLPWLPICRQTMRRVLQTPRQLNGFSPVLLLAVWSGCIFIFYSASHSKLISYTLPITPAVALLLGLYSTFVEQAQWRRHLVFQSGLITLGYIGALYLAYIGDAHMPSALYRTYQLWLYLALAIALIGIAWSAWINARGNAHARISALIVYAGGWLAAITVAGNAHEVFGRASAGIALVPAVQAELTRMPADAPFYSVAMLDHTMPFYLRQTMVMVQYPGELHFGIQQEPHKAIAVIDNWIARWRQDRQALALLPPPLYTALAARGVPMRIVARDARRVVIAKPNHADRF